MIVEALRAILKLRNLRRAEGDLGAIAGFRTLLNETEMNVYLLPDGYTSCRPGPLHIVVRALLLSCTQKNNRQFSSMTDAR